LRPCGPYLFYFYALREQEALNRPTFMPEVSATSSAGSKYDVLSGELNSRRDFLMRSGLGVAGTLLAGCSGSTASALLLPNAARPLSRMKSVHSLSSADTPLYTKTIAGINGSITISQYATRLLVTGTVNGSPPKQLLSYTFDTDSNIATIAPAGVTPYQLNYLTTPSKPLTVFSSTITPVSASTANFVDMHGNPGAVNYTWGGSTVSGTYLGYSNTLPIKTAPGQLCKTICPDLSPGQVLTIILGALAIIGGIAGIILAGPEIAALEFAIACVCIAFGLFGLFYDLMTSTPAPQ
jgi:hypothetical protein